MSQVNADTIRKSDGSLGTDIRVKNTSVYESDGGTSVTQNLVQGLTKVWANLKGTDTFGLRDSFNVTTATDNGTGNYTITINNDMGNNDYSVTGSQGGNTSNDEVRIPENATDFATGSYIVNTLKTGVALNDSVHVCTQVAGDLA